MAPLPAFLSSILFLSFAMPSFASIVPTMFDADDACVAYFLDHYGDENACDALSNYDHSDFINNDMCYSRDLLRFYDANETEVLTWLDNACEAYGYSSRMQLVEHCTIETPDDLKECFVNQAMSFCAQTLHDACTMA